MSNIPEDINQKLWIILPDCCDQKHYLKYNSHTFPGRMLVWCPKVGRYTRISKSEISDCSEQAKYWIEGYLAGQEPEPPRDKNGDYLPGDSAEFEFWFKSAALFAETGYWNYNKENCTCCGCHMLYSCLEDLCSNCKKA